MAQNIDKKLLKASEQAALQLEAHGVKIGYGIIGSAFMPLSYLFPKIGLDFYDMVHEQNAGFAAIGSAMVTGETSFATGQNSPGNTNYFSAIASAYWNRAPVFMYTPAAGAPVVGNGGFQELPSPVGQYNMFREVCTRSHIVTSPERTGEIFAAALNDCQRESGPVSVEMFRSHLYGEGNFAPIAPTIPKMGAGDLNMLEEAAKLLIGAKNPVIVAGNGSIVSGAQKAMETCAEYIGAAMIAGYQHNDAVSSLHPQSVGTIGYNGAKSAMNLIRKADVVLALGSRLGPFGILPQYNEAPYWPENAKLIQILTSGDDIGRTRPVDVGIWGDAKASMEWLNGRMKELGSIDSTEKRRRIAEITSAKQAWDTELSKWIEEDEPVSIEEVRLANERGESRQYPRAGFMAMKSVLTGDEVITGDIGNNCAIALGSYFKFNQPRSLLHPGVYGCCGFSLGAAIGAKIARPDRTVISMAGDGAMGLSFPELLTCHRRKIGITSVTFCNDMWGAEQRNQRKWFNNDQEYTNFPRIPYAAMAESMGLKSIVANTPEQLEAALKEGIERQHDGETVVIEASFHRVLGNPFRPDAMQFAEYYDERFADLNATPTNAEKMGVN